MNEFFSSRIPSPPGYGLTDEELADSLYDGDDSPLYGAGEFHNGFAYFKENGKYGFINKEGKKVIPAVYQNVSDFSEGLAAIETDDKWGFMNASGKTVIPCTYMSVGNFSEGLAKASTDYFKNGYIDHTGRIVIPIQYAEADDFKAGIAKVKKDGKYGIIDKTGKMKAVFPNANKYTLIEPFSEGLARVTISSPNVSNSAVVKYYDGYINTSGKEVIPVQYSSADDFSEGLSGYYDEENRLYGFFGKNGQTVIKPAYEDLRSPFSEGLCAVKKNDKWGFIDRNNKNVIDYKYELTLGFHEGMARFQQNNKWGYLDKTGKEVIPAKYDGNKEFSEGLALVNDNNKWMYVDKTGKIVIDRIK